MILLVLLLGLAGLVFCALGVVAYLLPALEAFRHEQFEFAIASVGRTEWHHTYSVHDYPVLFALRIMLDVTGAVGATGMGLLAFGALISLSTNNAGPIIKKMESLTMPWTAVSLGAFGAHFALLVIPYMMAFGILPIR